MAKKKKGKTASMLFKERLQSRKLWMGLAVIAIGIIFHLMGKLDKEFMGLLALIYISYAASNVTSKFAYMKYG